MQGFPTGRAGATIVESCLVMVLLCMMLFGILQVSIVTAAHDVLVYAASAGARCATVGYDEATVEKTIRIAALPSMGANKLGLSKELVRVKSYLRYARQASDRGMLGHISDEYWNSLGEPVVTTPGYLVQVNVVQEYPMTFPFVHALYKEDYTALDSEYSTEDGDELKVALENHADLYLLN
jgi:Flp pilus assembly protein TadG